MWGHPHAPDRRCALHPLTTEPLRLSNVSIRTLACPFGPRPCGFPEKVFLRSTLYVGVKVKDNINRQYIRACREVSRMSLAPEEVRALRQGRSGLAVVLYVDMPLEEFEDSWQEFPEVVALDRGAGQSVLDLVRSAVDAGHAVPLADRAAAALSLLLSTGVEWQSMLVPMLEGIAGRVPLEPAIAPAE